MRGPIISEERTSPDADPLEPHPVPTKTWALRRAAQLLTGEVRARVTAGREFARGARRSSALGIPRWPADVTPEWLTAVPWPDGPGATVISAIRSRDSAGTTTRAAVELVWNEAGNAAQLPTRLFVKCTSTLAQRLTLGLGGLIQDEPGFYNHARPELEIEAPVGYYAAVDERSWRSVVVMEDVVGTRGATFWRPSTSVDQAGIEDLLTVIPPGLRSRQADLYAGLRRSMRLATEGPETYLHGDLHIANTYVTHEGRMGIADWQVGLRGSWAHDYAYLLITALDVEDRRSAESELLDFYLEHLTAAGGGPVPRDQAWRAYRQATLYPYFAWVYTIGRSRLQPRFQPDEVSLTMIERISTAIDDLGSLGAVGL